MTNDKRNWPIATVVIMTCATSLVVLYWAGKEIVGFRPKNKSFFFGVEDYSDCVIKPTDNPKNFIVESGPCEIRLPSEHKEVPCEQPVIMKDGRRFTHYPKVPCKEKSK